MSNLVSTDVSAVSQPSSIANGSFEYFAPQRYQLTPIYLYEQYRSSALLREVFERLNNYIQSNYIAWLENFLNNISFHNSNNLFLGFYLQNYFGIARPLGSASLNSYYDIEEKFDTENTIYDESAFYDGKVGLKDFKKYIQFRLDYSYAVTNIQMLASFAAKWIECELSEIQIVQTIDTTTFYIPQTYSSGEFIKLIFAYFNELGLPYGCKIEFRYKDGSSNPTDQPGSNQRGEADSYTPAD